MAEEDEVLMEVDAVKSVYGDDCHVIQQYPPHLAVHIKPRTADDSSQQFVEATLGIKSSVEYPREPPYIYIVKMKGLDESRRTHLLASVNNKGLELSCCQMLVALCEEAVEVLSNMNHPEGDCPLCLYPLLTQDGNGLYMPFMKLMSCYHCFHSECILRWWKWLQDESKQSTKQQTEEATTVAAGNVCCTSVNLPKANCPVCRKDFDVQDMEHVLNYMDTNSSMLITASEDINENEKAVLESEKEMERRENFETLIKLQQSNNGLIEPRKEHVILPGMFLPEASPAPTTSTETSNGKKNSSIPNKVDASKPNNYRRRNNRSHHSRGAAHGQQQRGKNQWIRKEKGPSEQ